MSRRRSEALIFATMDDDCELLFEPPVLASGSSSSAFMWLVLAYRESLSSQSLDGGNELSRKSLFPEETVIVMTYRTISL